MGAPKIPNNVASIFFNIVRLRPKDLRFEHEGTKLAFCPRALINLVISLIFGKKDM